jgi:hypothetical protein
MSVGDQKKGSSGNSLYEGRIREYLDILSQIGFSVGDAATLTCPSCAKNFWMRWPPDLESRDGQILMACPYACGLGNDIRAFCPTIATNTDRDSYDTRKACPRSTSTFEYAANGIVLRCPHCYIENPREITADVVNLIRHEIDSARPAKLERHVLEALLGRVVATFDGVMRRMVEIAQNNYTILGRPQFPAVSSFQNLSSANTKLAAVGWDMSKDPSAWSEIKRAFQKRHLIVHTLGVVDQDYINKTGDSSVTAGKLVDLTGEEVLRAAQIAHQLASSFFGMFLS